MRWTFLLCLLVACGASGGREEPDAGDDVPDAAPESDAAPLSCLERGHQPGDHYPQLDHCNFCDCNADGTETCTQRQCADPGMHCMYGTTEHLYGERFHSSDPCNECVCAPSGLACTRRSCDGALEEGAILVESLDEPCGDPAFTAQAVLAGLPHPVIENEPFRYDRDGNLYRETLPDTTLTARIAYAKGFAVCRIPSPGQEAFDIEVVVEWVTADGAFDEGFHTYLRKDRTGFVNAWYSNMSYGRAIPLTGTYDPHCFDFNGYGFSIQEDIDGTFFGSASKVCESDILLGIASFGTPPF